MKKRLTKSRDKILTGVLGGIANYFGLDPAWVRIIGSALILFTGIFPGVALYFIAALVMPEPQRKDTTMTGKYTKHDK
ncbi:PspC domain-containing protein [Lactobacillus sp. PSON]|uniref:PspC domain-containing protein n=1 Tax=Lactobacillus sp. PSON TaxID=3455454 RepID=UPI004042443B